MGDGPLPNNIPKKVTVHKAHARSDSSEFILLGLFRMFELNGFWGDVFPILKESTHEHIR